MSSSSHRYLKSPTSESKQRIDIPIQRLSNNINYEFSDQHFENSAFSKDTVAQWINDSITNREKFRMKINIEGFNKNDVHIRVDGTRLFVYGERIENKNQGTSKKIIEKSYELPLDIDKSNPHVTFPSTTTMQVDFPSKYSSTRFKQSNGYISSQKRHTNDTYDRKAILDTHIHSPDNKIFHENQSIAIPVQRISIISKDSSPSPTHSKNQAYKFHEPIDDPIIVHDSPLYNQVIKKVHGRHASPTVGFSSPHDIDHQRSVSPALSRIIEEDHMTLSSSSSQTDGTINKNETSFFPRDFNSSMFYQSAFQPEIFIDDHNQRYIEMKLDVKNYKLNEIKVSINDNDLIVHVEHTNFYRRITLPSNTDLTTLSLHHHHHHDKILYITVKLLDEYSSFKYI